MDLPSIAQILIIILLFDILFVLLLIGMDLYYEHRLGK